MPLARIEQEVFEEIVANAIPLDEWPTYIFTRVFAAADASHQDKQSRQMLALKATAQHAKAAEEARAAATSSAAGGTGPTK